MRCRPATRATPMLNSSSIRLRRRESVSLGRFQNCNLLEMDHLRRHCVEDEHEEIAREVDQWLHVLFNGRRKTGHVDLEASEMMMRWAMRRVGAAGLTQLLRFAVPLAAQRTAPCSCGHTAHYQELRSKPVLTAVGRVEVSRPYYLCSHCHNGQFPADVALDIENKECSPGVRRMLAIVGQEAPFDHGRQ